MRKFIALSLFLLPLLSYGDNNSSMRRFMTITAKDIVSIEEISANTRQSFDDNGGKFQLLIPKERFVFRAPNCQKNVILRMWYVPPRSKDRQEQLDKHWQLLQTFRAIADGKVESVTVPITPRPYMKVDKKGEPILEYCNAFIPRDFWKYSPDKDGKYISEKPAEKQNESGPR